jgi:mannose-6-phosphate isomerase-like protein (cupin superfamily)
MMDKNNAEHYTWGDNCDGWHLLKSPEISIIQERMPPGTKEVWHKHTKSRQFFFILSGEAAMEADGEMHILKAQQGIEILPGTPHQMMNKSDADLEFIVVSCPPSHGDRVLV